MTNLMKRKHLHLHTNMITIMAQLIIIGFWVLMAEHGNPAADVRCEPLQP